MRKSKAAIDASPSDLGKVSKAALYRRSFCVVRLQFAQFDLSLVELISVHANHELPNSLADIAGVETFETKKFSGWRLLVRVQQAHDLMHGNVRVLNVRSFRYSGPPE